MNENAMQLGLIGVGLDTYWPQFPQLKPFLEEHLQKIAQRLSSKISDVKNLGIVDSVAASRARLAELAQCDVLVISLETYALSSSVLPLIHELKCPILLLSVQPTSVADFEKMNSLGDRQEMTGQWLSYAQGCPAPEFVAVFNRAAVNYHFAAGYLQDEAMWKDVSQWLQAAFVKKSMSNSVLGVLGHHYCGMLDIYTDMTEQCMVFGTEIKLLEMCELAALHKGVSQEEIGQKRAEFEQFMDVDPQCSEAELNRAAHTAAAMHNMVKKESLNALSYYYEGHEGNEYENLITSVIAGNTLLTNFHVPVVGECEIKTTQAMRIMDLLGAGGSFSEFYGTDFERNEVLLGHDGPAHAGIAEGKIKLVPLPVYHGKPGQGLSIQMEVVHGPVTVLSIGEDNNGLFFLVAEGETVAGTTFQIGNTNSRYKFSLSAADFVTKWCSYGPPHHMAVGLGHVAGALQKLAKLYSIPYYQVC